MNLNFNSTAHEKYLYELLDDRTLNQIKADIRCRENRIVQLTGSLHQEEYLQELVDIIYLHKFHDHWKKELEATKDKSTRKSFRELK